VPGPLAGISVIVVKDERHALVCQALPQRLEDVVGVRLVRDGEVEVRREPACVAEHELADRRAALQDDGLVLEQVLRAEPVEEMLLGELEVRLLSCSTTIG